jgi:O-glycosyl hydrolase
VKRGFNEPDIEAQANLSVTEAVELWNQYVLPMKKSCPGVRIGSPSISNGRHGFPWLVSFISALGGLQESGIDHIVLHFYGPAVQAFKDYVQQVHDAFGLPIWVTELACTNWDPSSPVSEKEVLLFMKEAVEFLEETSYVERYAWFGAMEDVGEGVGRANGLQKGNELTEAGKLYLSL